MAEDEGGARGDYWGDESAGTGAPSVSQKIGFGMKNRVLGMLLGHHTGDALGATLEFQPPRHPNSWLRDIEGGGNFKWRPGQATDDTDLMLCVLDALVSRKEFSFPRLKNNLLEWYKSGPIDIGTTTRKGLIMLTRGHPVEHCGDDHEGSQGNGSLMRCAPLALLDTAAETLADVVKKQASITHAHPRCIRADWSLVSSLQALLQGHPKQSVYQSALLSLKARDDVLYESLAGMSERVWEHLATSGYVVDTLTAGFWALLHSTSFEDAMVKVINRGDDADTCGAVAGALCGAFYGAKAIPHRWLNVIEQKGAIESHVERLFPQNTRSSKFTGTVD